MAIKLNEWKSRLQDTLPSHSFMVNIAPPVGGTEDLQLRTEAINLPGVGYAAVDNFSPYGNGKMYNIPYKYMPQEISMSHFLDEKADLYAIYRAWSNEIVDLDGDSKYGAKYLSGYSVDMNVFVYNRKGELAKEIKFIEAFPIVVEPISLNWAQTDDIAKLNVSYRFTRFEVK